MSVAGLLDGIEFNRIQDHDQDLTFHGGVYADDAGQMISPLLAVLRTVAMFINEIVEYQPNKGMNGSSEVCVNFNRLDLQVVPLSARSIPRSTIK